MKKIILKSSLFIFSIVTLSTIGVNATEYSTETSSTSEAKTEFKVESIENGDSIENTETIEPNSFSVETTEKKQ